MIQHVTPLGWFLWLAVAILEVVVLCRAWRKLPLLALLMVWELISDGAGMAMMFGSMATYARVYMASGIAEYALIGAAAIELCGNLQPAGYRRVIRYGPVVIAGPIFFQIITAVPLLTLFQLKFHIMAYAASVLLLLACYVFEEVEAPGWVSQVVIAYLIFLGLMIAEMEKFGVTYLQVVWLLGLAGLCWSLRRNNLQIAS